MRSRHLLLGLILAVAAVARLCGINFGFPHLNCRPDEGSIASIVGGMLHGDLNPHTFNYPALFMLTVTSVLSILHAANAVLQRVSTDWALDLGGTTTTYRIARYLSAAAGIASVLIVYRIGRRLFGATTALAAAALLATAFLHVRDSHFGVTDVPMTFMVVVTFLFVVRLSESGTTRDLIAAGVAGGLAMATKYNAALIALPALLAILTGPAEMGRSVAPRLRSIVLYGSMMVAAFLVTSPYSVLDFQRFVADVSYESRHLAQGHGVILGRGWIHHLASSLRYGVGLPVLMTGIFGFALLLWRDLRKGLLVALFPVSYYLLIGTGYTVFARYILPVVPFLCLTAGYTVTEAGSWVAARWRRPRLAPVIIAAGVVALLLPSAISVVNFDRLISRTDSRLMARRWVERQQFPPGTTIDQLGPDEGHVFLMDRDSSEVKYERVDLHRPGARPDLVIVHSSPLAPVPSDGRITRILARDYEVAFSRDVVGTAPENVYDWQDAFYLPLTGFKDIERPGPNLTIYIRRGAFPDVPRLAASQSSGRM